ncbi:MULTISPECIES: hypothetical protein [unclassified Oleiphilus]|jgi:hypothetical protein|uniref:hypothetical protein n=1 Tax=unclassified Oleiphilus TaxID=2631174 RepID=UPI000A8007DC|nr:MULTISPECIES: hypothetical protein [unclassified Oleiphilus]
MHYELIYTQDEHKGESLIGAQIDKTFVPKKPEENEQGFLSRLNILTHSDTEDAN